MSLRPFQPFRGFGGGAVQAAFDPLSLSPALWLDASDSSTLFDAVSGGGIVAADGAIARWEDKSGNLRHLTQATSGARPLRKTTILGGRDIVRFDGSNDVLTAASIPIASPAEGTLFLIARRAAGSTGDFLTILEIGQFFRLVISTSGASTLRNGINFIAWADSGTTTIDRSQGYAMTTSDFFLMALGYDGGAANAASSYSLRINGSAVSIIQGTVTLSALGRANGIGIGARATSAGFVGVDFAEIMLLPYNATTEQISAVEVFMSEKWL